MSVGRICTRTVATASSGESVMDVARRMAEYNVGTVVVVDPSRKPVGIVTDRDIVLRSVAQGQDGESTPVSVVMTRGVRTADESLPIEQALQTMAGAEARRLVVTGPEGQVAGLVSLDDILELLAGEAETIGRILRQEAPRLAGV
jgi:signal-transduction protein with cAMP-binding, CBS, and nucleotidyltransferase domain